MFQWLEWLNWNTLKIGWRVAYQWYGDPLFDDKTRMFYSEEIGYRNNKTKELRVYRNYRKEK
jgi:hypothetical protein